MRTAGPPSAADGGQGHGLGQSVQRGGPPNQAENGRIGSGSTSRSVSGSACGVARPPPRRYRADPGHGPAAGRRRDSIAGCGSTAASPSSTSRASPPSPSSEGDERAVAVLTAFRALGARHLQPPGRAHRQVAGRRGHARRRGGHTGAGHPARARVRRRPGPRADHRSAAASRSGDVILHEGDDYIGHAVNLAARLCDLAPGGEVLATPAAEALPTWGTVSADEDVCCGVSSTRSRWPAWGWRPSRGRSSPTRCAGSRSPGRWPRCVPATASGASCGSARRAATTPGSADRPRRSTSRAACASPLIGTLSAGPAGPGVPRWGRTTSTGGGHGRASPFPAGPRPDVLRVGRDGAAADLGRRRLQRRRLPQVLPADSASSRRPASPSPASTTA